MAKEIKNIFKVTTSSVILGNLTSYKKTLAKYLYVMKVLSDCPFHYKCLSDRIKFRKKRICQYSQ